MIVLLLSQALSAAGDESVTAAPLATSEAGPPAPSPAPTGAPKKVELTNRQVVIVCSAIAASFFIIVGEGALTCWCRRRQRGVVPIELGQVMLPSPEDAYAAEQL
jgi:hypothetical protein